MEKKMNKVNRRYAQTVVSHIPVNSAYKKRIMEDIMSQLEDYHGVDKPENIMGRPDLVAQEFIDNIEPSDLRSRVTTKRGYRYESESRLLGLPLLAVNVGNKEVAKGIVAIGDVAVGGLAIGVVSIGLCSLGAVSIGLLALAGMAVGLLAALGGVAVSGGIAVGGMAVAYQVAIGGFAVAKTLAVGGYAVAKNIAMGDTTEAVINYYKGNFTGEIGFAFGSISPDSFVDFVKDFYPKVPRFILNLIKWMV